MLSLLRSHSFYDWNARKQAGMTLVELIAVVVLIGVIMAIVGGGIFEKAEGAKAQANMTKMQAVKQALDGYRLQFGRYPASIDDLVRPPAEVKSSGQLFTPFINEEGLKDVWQAPFIYKPESNGRAYTLSTLGADGVAGGEGADQDVTTRP